MSNNLTANNNMSIKKVYALIIISLFYLTFSLACDPMAFRQISLYGHIMSGSALLYGPLYVLLDMLTRIGGRSMAIRLMLLFHFFDFLFTYILYSINLLPVPASFKNLALFNTLITPMPTLFWAGILGAIIAGLVEIMLYASLQKRFKSFLLPSFASTSIILIAHNIPTYYFSFHKLFPDTYQQMFVVNTSIELATIFLVSSIAAWFFRNSNSTAA